MPDEDNWNVKTYIGCHRHLQCISSLIRDMVCTVLLLVAMKLFDTPNNLVVCKSVGEADAALK